MSLSEVDSMMQHVKFGKGIDGRLRSPMLVNVGDDGAPRFQLITAPIAGVKKTSRQLRQPLLQNGDGCFRLCCK